MMSVLVFASTLVGVFAIGIVVGILISCPWNVYVTKRYCRLCRERMVEQLTKKVSE